MESTTDDLRDLNLKADDVEEEDEEEAHVRLAFLRDPDGPEELQRHMFPDKAGGAPAWLDPVNLPTGEARLCGFCGEPLRFALQVYAPLPPWEDDDEDAAYHRALFVFMCPAMACLLLDQRQQREGCAAGDDAAGGCRRRSVRVFRCQLPLENAFYYYSAAGDGEEEEARGVARCTGVEAAPLCEWCGTWGAEIAFDDFAMALRLFCSQKHLDRQLGCHAAGGGGGPSASAWPEYAMSSVEETLDNDDDNSPTAAQEQSGGEDNHDEQENATDDGDDDQAAAVDDAWMAAFEADEDTAQWATFQARVSGKQDQVLRYCDGDGGGGGGGGPLWAVASGSLPPGPGAAPPCARCGGARRYELQLMPQLLHYLHVEARDPDPLDWVTVAVYTCARSCGDGGGYVEEFAWVQLLPTTTTAAATAAAK